jgi:hypothetical protein
VVSFQSEPLFGKPVDGWRRWFAWRPVRTANAGWVWLRFVEWRACVWTVTDHHQGDVFFQYRVR